MNYEDHELIDLPLTTRDGDFRWVQLGHAPGSTDDAAYLWLDSEPLIRFASYDDAFYMADTLLQILAAPYIRQERRDGAPTSTEVAGSPDSGVQMIDWSRPRDGAMMRISLMFSPTEQHPLCGVLHDTRAVTGRAWDERAAHKLADAINTHIEMHNRHHGHAAAQQFALIDLVHDEEGMAVLPSSMEQYPEPSLHLVHSGNWQPSALFTSVEAVEQFRDVLRVLSDYRGTHHLMRTGGNNTPFDGFGTPLPGVRWIVFDEPLEPSDKPRTVHPHALAEVKIVGSFDHRKIAVFAHAGSGDEKPLAFAYTLAAAMDLTGFIDALAAPIITMDTATPQEQA